MKHTNKSQKCFKSWAAVLTLAASLLIIGLFTACPNAAGGGGGSITPVTPGKAVLTVDTDNKTIKITVITSGGSKVTVEGADKTSINSGEETELTAIAADNKITLKNAVITELKCGGNKLTALDIQELSDLQALRCYQNQLTELNVDNVTKLSYLDCDENQLTALKVDKLTELLR